MMFRSKKKKICQLTLKNYDLVKQLKDIQEECDKLVTENNLNKYKVKYVELKHENFLLELEIIIIQMIRNMN